MSYNKEMVQQFAQSNREEIDELVQINPTLGNLVKKLLNSMTGEENQLKVTTIEYASDTPPKNAIYDSNGVIWLPLEETADLKFNLSFPHSPAFQQRVQIVSQFITTTLDLPHKAILLKDALKALLLIGGFYELYTSKQNIDKYKNKYSNKPISLVNKVIEYEVATEYQDAFGINKIDISFDTASEGMDSIVEFMMTEVFKFDEMTSVKRKLLKENVVNAMILAFLNGEGYLGFYNYNSGGLTIPKGWYKVLETNDKEAVLEDAEGETRLIKVDDFGIRININIIAMDKPKFKVGDTVRIIENSSPEFGKTVTVNEILADVNKRVYIYELELIEGIKRTLMFFTELSLEKVEPITKTIKAKKSKVTPTTVAKTPQEIEISNMSQEDLKALKEELNEGLSYLEDTDPEKKDLLVQLELVNLYLEN